MEEDWDLQAVVRGCASTSATSSSSSSTITAASFLGSFHSDSGISSFGGEDVGRPFSFPDPFEATHVSEELHELYKPFFPKSQPLSPQTSPISPLISPLSSFSASSKAKTQQQQQQQQQPKQSQACSGTNPRSKRRKNLLKKVCQVPAEGLSSDIWAWRKYGQKPIKGSPYPRGYYRCSSSKGCLARKQVERNRSDPGMFIVTYTGEHNHPAPTHRNSLAGSTRQKPLTTQTVTAGDSKRPNSAKPSSPANSMEDELALPQSTTIDSKEDSREEGEDLVEEEEEEDEFGISDVALSDDFFAGLEGIVGPEVGDYFSDNLPATFMLPNWVTNNAG
ncbi:hypothetical protein I3843_02G026900 [Carya illinoinensis]|uniref:WRKY domain-containing protein n=1 Tax=Carya illinoinensis TaxID=32201 RepID=A0A8T1RAB8_CARIL|nr:WRKY transcription factor 22-like [Carya illinoinensis]KAG2720443.1 hypothetical protein I3760_02G035200 [Carya illinoinensis]KAG6663575.1 hypothetical protein CIPAW_02G034700 [Carya illinoinensis]KAG6725496.1 hypothetical protein I3842_02G034700 [Carya illinoinensis]KAG7990481.1 hypothetical protein I3843_02G026900 [Carya illinoinensis]